MKKRMLLTACISCLILIAVAVPANACTEIYVGRDVSADGSIILARSNDNRAIWPNRIVIEDAVKNKSGIEMPFSEDGKTTVPVRNSTFKYTTTPWMDSTIAQNGLGRDGACGANENGVIMTMAVTAFSNDSALDADPLVENGLGEQSACDLVLAQAKTAKDGVKILADLIDKYGNGQVNIATIADSKEVWYMEMYTGHQYVAVKLPSDKVAVFGNEFTLEYVSAYEDNIASKNIEKLAVNNDFAVYGDDDELNLYKTYSGDSFARDYCRMRTWIGHKLLAPSEYGDYSQSELYPLTFTPEDKVSFDDVTELIRNRFEGSEYSPDETGRTDMRVIGTDTAMSVHILQLFPDLPKDMSAVIWECTGPAVYGVFVPVSNAQTEISEAYSGNQPEDEQGSFDTEKYPWYAIKELNTIGMTDYEAYGAPVRACFKEAEKTMYQEMIKVLKDAAEQHKNSPEEAAATITQYCNQVQNQAFEDEKRMLNKVKWAQSLNSNTMKNGINPETGDVNAEAQKSDPAEVEIDTGKYTRKQTEEAEKDSSFAAFVKSLFKR